MIKSLKAMEDNMADKKTVTPEEKQLAAEKHVDGLVKKALVALDEMRKLNQEHSNNQPNFNSDFQIIGCLENT